MGFKWQKHKQMLMLKHKINKGINLKEGKVILELILKKEEIVTTGILI
jgi:hypothetical protein